MIRIELGEASDFRGMSAMAQCSYEFAIEMMLFVEGGR